MTSLETMQLQVAEVILKGLPDDDQKKIEMARESLRDMVKIDPATICFAIMLVSLENQIKAKQGAL